MVLDPAQGEQQLHDMDIAASEATSTPVKSFVGVKGNRTVRILPYSLLTLLF
jgi:hypothetical protein